MEDVRALEDALDRSLDGLDPSPFRDRVTRVVGRTPATPGVLTIRTARTIDPEVDIEAAATRGAGVQLCYEGLELTRSILRNRPWMAPEDREEYYPDLLVAEVLVSRGFGHLSSAGVVMDVVETVQRFGQRRSDTDQIGGRNRDDPLEQDVLELGVNAGADLVLDGVSPAIRARSRAVATKLLDCPLPDPERLVTIDEQLDRLAGDGLARTNR